MRTHQGPADTRPFLCRADLEREKALDAHYRNLGIGSVAAAVAQCSKAKADLAPAGKPTRDPDVA